MSNGTTTPETGTPVLGPGQPATLGPLRSPGANMVLGSDLYRVALEPTTLEDAFRLASMAASMRLCDVASAEDALIRILTGRSLGLSAMQSFRGVYIVKGKPSLDASLMQALCMKSPFCEYFAMVSSDEKQATYKTKRVGSEERVLTYTIEDAARQGLVNRGTDERGNADSSNNNYTKIPKQMLRARCKSELARLEYPDVIFGMHSREELESGAIGDGLDDAVDAIARDENEMEAEVIVSPVQAAPRDFAKEAADLADLANAAKTREDMAAVRKKLEAWDAVEPHKSVAVKAYNEANKALKAGRAGSAASEAAAPSPLPEGNLFTKEPPKP